MTEETAPPSTFNSEFLIFSVIAYSDDVVPPPFSRCEKAKQLLYETNLSVSEVGAAVGYVSSAHFSHLFKKMTGIAPSDWRAPDLFSIKDPIDFTGLM